MTTDLSTTIPYQNISDTSTDSLSLHGKYISLVESYIENANFKDMDESKTKELSDMLKGDYTIIGRTAGEGMDYYLAVRRPDAPKFNNPGNINIGYYSGPDTDGEILQIGNFNSEASSTILYELKGYYILEVPFGDQAIECFCFGKNEDLDKITNPGFKYAFTENGRKQLDFMKKHKGLSFYNENTPCIEFYYQDDDTVKFYTTPFSCYININSDELDALRTLLSSSIIEDNIKSRKEAWKFLYNKDSSIRTTGARLNIDGRLYELLGNKNSCGYLMSFTDDHIFISLEYNEAVYKYVMDKIKAVVTKDYGSFDAKWFETPLKSATINFPERIEQADGSYISELRTQTVNDDTKLKALSKLMDKAINSEEIYGFSSCPYIATIDFIRTDGESLRIFIATDSCDSFTYDGRIGFEYGKQSDLAKVFDEALAYRLND